MNMREGDMTVCPGCNIHTRVKLHLIMEDWSVKRKVLICPFCGFIFCDAEEKSTDGIGEKKSSARLAALLGDDVETDNIAALSAAPGDEKVCRNCRHLAEHPFKTVCLITRCEVDLMGDCEKFETRQTKGEEK